MSGKRAATAASSLWAQGPLRAGREGRLVAIARGGKRSFDAIEVAELSGRKAAVAGHIDYVNATM